MPEQKIVLSQLGVLGFGLLQDGDVGIGVLPEFRDPVASPNPRVGLVRSADEISR